MDIRKILVTLGQQEIPLSVELFPGEDNTVYRATSDRGTQLLNDPSPAYIDFDESGGTPWDDSLEEGTKKEMADAIWLAIREQVIEEYR